MHRSSETIGAIAAALAKAQAEITNPEKSLTATIRSPFAREEDRTFRYAPPSSRPAIVRQCLRRMDFVRLAGVPGLRDGGAASPGRCPHLCAPLCAVHAGGDCRGR